MTHKDDEVFHKIAKEQYLRALEGLYGIVAQEQNAAIASAIHGKRILDVGAGLGTLAAGLKEQGFIVVAIDPNEQKRELAKELYDLEVLDESIYGTSFGDSSFDCVILREVVFHLDFAKALAEISRLTRDQVIIFQGNDSFIRKAGQSLFGHREFNEQCRNYYLRQLEYGGFKIEDLQYRDTLAFALSGGFIGYQLLPQSEFLYSLTMKCDGLLTFLLDTIGLLPFCALRYLVSARKPIMVSEDEEYDPSATLSLELG